MDYGFLALLPPIIAILIAFLTKDVVISLSAGVFLGTTVIYGWNPFLGLIYSVSDFIVPSMASEWNAAILFQAALFGIMSTFLQNNGGAVALGNAMTKRMKTKKSTQVAVFLTGAIISFSTGTSYGTFAILIPIAIPLAIQLNAPLYPMIAAAFSGGLFGDHCSPISDITVMASTGAACDHIDHVQTQLPYALLCAAVSTVGFVVSAAFASVIVTNIIIFATLMVALFALNKATDKIENKIKVDIERSI